MKKKGKTALSARLTALCMAALMAHGGSDGVFAHAGPDCGCSG